MNEINKKITARNEEFEIKKDCKGQNRQNNIWGSSNNKIEPLSPKNKTKRR